MVVSLAKGQKVDLTKTNPGLTKVSVGLGWDTNKYDGGNEFDLEVISSLPGSKFVICVVLLTMIAFYACTANSRIRCRIE